MNSEPNSVIIRIATLDDAQQLLNIYAPYVEKTAITFEYDVPTLAEFKNRISNTLIKYPYLVAEKDGEILGYAYASAFIERAAYDWSVETTIYLSSQQTKNGLGKKLYLALERVCKAQNIYNLNACIAYPEREDQFLSKNSAEFHAYLGYRLVGEFRKCGYKFGRWYNMVWMEKLLAEHPPCPEPLIPFSALTPETLKELGISQY